MATLTPSARISSGVVDATDRYAVDIVVPVYNEAHVLEASIRRLTAYLDAHFVFSSVVTIVDNGSTDGTAEIARSLADTVPGVRAINLREKGRGRALRRAWLTSDATVVAYMDVDLSTDLRALLPLVAPLLSGHSDVSIGSRLARGSRVVRGTKREFISRGYNLILRTVMRVRFSDAQCGFKAMRRDRALEVIPLVQDEEWFFDTELLLLAERAGLRIHEVPVDWVDDPDSRVNIVRTALADLRGIARVGRGLVRREIPLSSITPRATPAAETSQVGLARQLVRFGLVGVLSTVLFAVLFVVFRAGGLGPQLANAGALGLSTIVNTQVNRRHTFGITGRSGAVQHQAQGFVILGLALVLTAGGLAGLHHWVPDPSRTAEIVTLTVANIMATLVKFLLFRGWVFRGQRPSSTPTEMS